MVTVNKEPFIAENDSQQIAAHPKIEKRVCLDLGTLNIRHIKRFDFPFPFVQDIAHEQSSTKPAAPLSLPSSQSLTPVYLPYRPTNTCPDDELTKVFSKH